MVISVNRRLFRYFGSYSGISVIPVILVNRRTLLNIPNFFLGKSSVTTIYCLFLFIYVRDIITTMFHITEFIDTYFYLGVYPTRVCPRERGN